MSEAFHHQIRSQESEPDFRTDPDGAEDMTSAQAVEAPASAGRVDVETAAKTLDHKKDLAAARAAVGLGPGDTRGPAAIDVYYTDTVNGEPVVNIPVPFAVDRYLDLARADEKRIEQQKTNEGKPQAVDN